MMPPASLAPPANDVGTVDGGVIVATQSSGSDISVSG